MPTKGLIEKTVALLCEYPEAINKPIASLFFTLTPTVKKQ